jgi:N-acetyl sugar amidotransferase
LWEEEKKNIEWGKRERKLSELAEWAKTTAVKRDTYDAALGVSGGKDTLFTALYVRDKLGLNCLLVNAAPESITDTGRKNLENLRNHGFDMITIAVNPLIQKKLMRRDFRKYLQIRKSSEYPLWASVYTVAKEKNIPLVVQGENAALTLGVSQGMNTDDDASQIFRTNTLGGKTAAEEFADTVGKKDIFLYQFPNLSNWDGRAIWIQYYAKEWSQYGNAQFAIKHGLILRDDDLHELGRLHHRSAIDSDFHMVNQLLKYVKFGFGFATDEACYDIREGRLSRDEAVNLVKEYDGLCGEKYISKFCDWIGIGTDEFWQVVDNFVNRKLFKKDPATGKWKPLFSVGYDFISD